MGEGGVNLKPEGALMIQLSMRRTSLPGSYASTSGPNRYGNASEITVFVATTDTYCLPLTW